MMFKKFLISCMLTSTFASWAYASYRVFTPEVASVIYNTTVLESSDSSQQRNYTATPLNAPAISADTTATTTDPEKIIIFYCTGNNGDCDYLNSQIFPIIASELDVTVIPKIEYTDVNTLAYQSANKRKLEYGFTTFPAFVIEEMDDTGTYLPTKCLENNPASPLTADELMTWLQDNGIFDFS